MSQCQSLGDELSEHQGKVGDDNDDDGERHVSRIRLQPRYGVGSSISCRARRAPRTPRSDRACSRLLRAEMSAISEAAKNPLRRINPRTIAASILFIC